jgi:hypothetical protein
MKKIAILTIMLAAILTACGDFGPVSSGPNPFSITPSRPPTILTSTPIFIVPTTSLTLPPPPSLTPSATASETPLGPSETFTPIPTNTDTPTATSTFPPTPIPFTIAILGCDTGLDVTHGMGEVTNAYVVLTNRSGTDLTNACLSLSAADEGRPHPDKTRCIPLLANGYQVTLKLTVDTTTNAATLVQVTLTSDQVSLPADPAAACTPIGLPAPSDDMLGIPVPIP